MNRTYSSRGDADLATHVPSVEAGYFYHCPNLLVTERHINDLREVLAPTSNWAEHRRDIAKRDIDLLLTRWLYLQTIGLPDSEVA
jgi:hypothetical protein